MKKIWVNFEWKFKDIYVVGILIYPLFKLFEVTMVIVHSKLLEFLHFLFPDWVQNLFFFIFVEHIATHQKIEIVEENVKWEVRIAENLIYCSLEIIVVIPIAHLFV